MTRFRSPRRQPAGASWPGLPGRLVLGVIMLGTALAGCTPEPRAGGEPQMPRSAADTARPPAPDTVTELEIRFLDVGQGDAALVRIWNVVEGERNPGPVALLDAGPADRIVAQLRSLGVERIDLLVASHNHLDHIGGMDAVLDSIPVRFYLDNGHPATTRIQQRVLERVEARGVTYLEPNRRTLNLGPARLRVIPAPDDVGGDEQNNRSLTIVLEKEDFSALFTGDAEVQLLNALLAAGDVPSVDVLKASHHGSRNGVTPGFLARASPSLVVISLGAGNRYGHPHASALRYFCAGGRRVLRTDRYGDVVVTVDADGTYRVATGAGGSEPGRDDVESACPGIMPADSPSPVESEEGAGAAQR